MMHLDRISANPLQCGGRPFVRGSRVRVADVIALYADGLDSEAILARIPELEREDLRACLDYAVRRVSHPVAVAA
jgi:uncharacterized protein (DUF433 family)